MKDARLVVGTEGITGGFALAAPPRTSASWRSWTPWTRTASCSPARRSAQLCAVRGDAARVGHRGECRIDLFMTEAERNLREFLASKTLADLVCEFSCKAPAEFAAESSGWFQERRAGRTSRRGRGKGS